jgi:hypothetical protein
MACPMPLSIQCMTTEPDLARAFLAGARLIACQFRRDLLQFGSLRSVQDNGLLAMALRFAAGSAKNCVHRSAA